ncbi:uncharacterized protein LOC130948751 [Arachis stenosperma]|uniref:uncharacterized protein LOC130948751 n=1 Tax=Arachis stenosperma TaxID=217475 RepID=UPI0025AD02A2|nr:uncharacterized protein LOC130948751 [Arachis stenosperma]XP_057733593.1 uncharacterized protein LOC130948751 [Arachis stenosperma]
MILNHVGAGFRYLDPGRPDPNDGIRVFLPHFYRRRVSLPCPAAFHGVHLESKCEKRRSICTADELHRVPVSNSGWNLALWRYLPSPKAPMRNHPLLLLSGVATNAIGYDLSPDSSFARYMSAQGFDTWTLEVRGAGLSTHGDNLEEDPAISGGKNSASSSRTLGFSNLGASLDTEGTQLERGEPEVVAKFEELQQTTNLMDIFPRIFDRLQDILEGQQLLNYRERFTANLEEFQKQVKLVAKHEWDFDHYLEEDVPAAMEYIKAQCQPRDGKLLAIGHSMGGILLYAMLSRSGFDGQDPRLVSVVTLASSLDYTPSRSSLKFLLPLAKPAQALNVPVIPVGPLMATAYPFAKFPPYMLSWLKSQISAQDMMNQKLFDRLVLNNFCTVPSKLLLQLTTAFQKGGLRDRNGTFYYKDHLGKSKIPVLAVAGDQDLICPPEAVYDTAKLFPKDLVTYKVFGEAGGPHYGHYDLVGSHLVYPCITEFLIQHDMP